MLNQVFLKIFGRSKFTYSKNHLIIKNSRSILNKDVIINTKDLNKINFEIIKEIEDPQNIGNFNLLMNYTENGQAKSLLIGRYKEEKFAIGERDRILASFYGKSVTVIKTVSVTFFLVVFFNLIADVLLIGALSRSVPSMPMSTGSLGTNPASILGGGQPNVEQAIAQINENRESLKAQGIDPDMLISQIKAVARRLPGGLPNGMNIPNIPATPSSSLPATIPSPGSQPTPEAEAALKAIGK